MNTAAMTTDAFPAQSKRPLKFRWIALTFAALLAIGLALAIVVYRRYVGYRPVAAHHVLGDATFAARFDLTHVMLYEPFRRSVFPVAEIGGTGRRGRLAEHGIEVGGDVRELVFSVGANPSHWVIALGGPLAERSISATLAAVLRSEGRRVEERDGVFVVAPGRVAFGQARDGALLFASDESRLRSVLEESKPPAALGQGAGGFRVTQPWLPPGLESLEGSYRAGSVVLVELAAKAAGGTPQADTESAVKAVLDQVGKLDPLLAESVAHSRVHAETGRASAELSLSNSAMERLAERLIEELSRRE